MSQMAASRYNQIPHIDDQAIPSIAQLLSVGEILVRHNVHTQFGVHLLHRHFEIDDETIMFGFLDGDREYSKMTKVAALDTQKLHPQCFLFDGNDGFIPYEYKYDERSDGLTMLPSPLSDDLSKHFKANDLEHLFAIERILADGPDLNSRFCREYPAEDFATFRIPVDDGMQDIDKDTAWIFQETNDGLVTVQTTCQWRSNC